MKAGTILFNGADLALYGAPSFTLQRTPETAAPGRATHRRVVISVKVALEADMPATVWARAERLQALLAATPEGLLEIHSENGPVKVWNAVPGESSLPEAISRRSGQVTLTFTAREAVAEGASPVAMTIDPLDGGAVLAISRVSDWTESVRQGRPDSRNAMRDEIGSTITFSARTAFADPLLPAAERAEFLLEEVERLRRMASKEARVVFCGFDQVVQFENFAPKPSPGWEWIDLEAQARYVTLPGDTLAEVSFTVETSENPATGEIRTTVSGTVEAPEKATAEEKAAAILTAWRTPQRQVVKIQKKDAWLDGEDADSGPEWTRLDFTYEFTEGTTATRYTVKIDTHEGADGCHTTYSGTATAATLEVLLATVETAAGNKHPVETRSDLTVEWATDDEGELKLVSGTFSHEYQTPATRILGTVTQQTGRGQFDDWQTTVSGTISAPSHALARTAARGFIPGGVILRTDDETQAGAFVSNSTGTEHTQQFVTLAFTYAWATAHTNTSIQYEETVNREYSKMVQETTCSGTCHAADKATATAAITALLAAIGLSNPTRESVTHSHERQTSGATTISQWLSFKFSFTFETALTGTIGHDIIEASFALQRIGMVDHEPMTEMPLRKPIQQTAFGHNIGRLVASGTVKARVKATAKAWGQGKRGQAATAGGYTGAEDPPDERMEESYVPFSGTEVACHTFTFQYAFRYRDGLTGLM